MPALFLIAAATICFETRSCRETERLLTEHAVVHRSRISKLWQAERLRATAATAAATAAAVHVKVQA